MPDAEESGQRVRCLALEFVTEDPWEQQLARDYWLVDGDGKFVFKVGDLERRAYDERPALARERISGLAYYLRKRVRAHVPAASCPGCGARVHVDNRPDYQKTLKLLQAGEVQACAPCRAAAADAADRAVAAKLWREDHGWYDQYPPVKVGALSLREAVSLLAIFRVPFDNAFTSTTPLQRWRQRLVPPYAGTELDARARMRELIKAGLLFPHPDCPSSGYRAVHSRTQEVSLNFEAARLTAPGPGPTGPRNEALVADLVAALTGSWPERWHQQRTVECRKLLHAENTGYLIRALHEHGLPAPRHDLERDIMGRLADTLTLAEAVYLIETATERAHEQLRQGHLANVREATNQVLDRLRWYLCQITAGEAEPKALTTLPAPCSIVATTFFRTAMRRDSALHERADPLTLPPATEAT